MTIMSMIVSMCGGDTESTPVPEETTTTSTTTTFAPSKVEVFNEADCCCSIVKSLEEAINDNHFKVREIFSRKISNEEGKEIPALPVPIDNQFRKGKLREEAPKLGLHNNLFFS